MQTYYLTSSLPYTNANPHIGFALEIVQADVIARWHRQKGEDVFFLTGTDEHGIKVARTAAEAGVPPQEFTDHISSRFRELMRALRISNDDFIRTTDQERHWPAVREVWKKLQENMDLEKKAYEGLYCSGCEAFITEKELVEGKCSIHKKEPEKIAEENWFFHLHKYTFPLKEKIEKGELQIVPETKKKEVLQFIESEPILISVSRPKEKLQWGIPVPGDDTQVVYVWLEALVNYISALGYPDGQKFKKYWPANIHIIGKDILRFHAVIWPAILRALKIDLPKTIFVHGFITVEWQKMSKSLGNVVDPFALIEKYGTDAVRYYLLREIPPFEDGDFTEEKFKERYNSDLANGLGNLVSRVLSLAQRNNSLKPPYSLKGADQEFTKFFRERKNHFVEDYLDNFRFSEALEAIWYAISWCDKYIEYEKPWASPKPEVIGNLLFALGEIANLLKPFLPETSEKILKQLQEGKGESLFPRK